MSIRANVITKYVIEYGSAGLAYGQDLILALSAEYMADAYTGGDEHSDASIWEFNKAQFKAMTETLSKMTSEEYRSKCNEWGVDPEKYPKDYVVELFHTWLKETPEQFPYVLISWF